MSTKLLFLEAVWFWLKHHKPIKRSDRYAPGMDGWGWAMGVAERR